MIFPVLVYERESRLDRVPDNPTIVLNRNGQTKPFVPEESLKFWSCAVREDRPTEGTTAHTDLPETTDKACEK